MPNGSLSNLIPCPADCLLGDGQFRLPPQLTLSASSGRETANQLAALLDGWLKLRHVAGACVASDSPQSTVQVEVEENKTGEAYQLEIAKEAITIVGSSKGCVRAIAALVMMLDQGQWPVCRLRDQPRFQWRGMHLDVCRHFYSISFVKRLIDLIALHRMNTFHWHLTDDQGWRLAIDAFPQLAEVSAWRDRDGQSYGGYYTKGDVQEVLAYAAEREIQVVPEIEMPGHARAALTAFPSLSCTGGPHTVPNTCGIFDDVYCAGKEATFEFLEKVLEEVVQLFPSRYLHIGGDECPKTRWKECPCCQERMKSEGLNDADELQSWFITRIGKRLDAMGKHLVGWDEILEGGLPPSAVVMSWRGIKGGIEAARMGHDVIMSPTTHCYFDYRQSDEPEEPGNLGRISMETMYGYEPIPPELNSEESSRILGVQGNIWTERMPTWNLVEYMTLPRLCALSEVAWSPPESRDWDDFQRRLERYLTIFKETGFFFRHPQRDHREFPL